MEKKGLLHLIKEYRLQIGLFLFFFVLVAQIPLFHFNVLPNLQLKLMAVRCLILDVLSGGLFFYLERGEYKNLLPFPLLGALLSLLYLKFGSFFLLPFCLSATTTSVIMVALVAYLTIKVNYGKG